MPKKVPRKTKDLPATHGMVLEVRDELKADIRKLDAKVDSGFSELKALFHEAVLRFEEQRSENKAVLEGLQLLTERQDRIEGGFVEVRETVRSLAKSALSKGRA